MQPVQVARFNKPLGALRQLVTPESTAPEALDATLDAVVARDARGALFALEGLLRLYRAVDGPPFEGLLEEVKALEDLIGKHTEKAEYLEFAERKAKAAPPAAVDVLRRDAEATRSALRAALPGLPAFLDRLEGTLEARPWRPEAEDGRRVLGAIGDELRRIDPDEYDLRDLQAGIHELRRDLRWFLVYVQAVDGLIEVPRGVRPLRLNVYTYLETHPLAESRFSKVERNPALAFTTRVPFAYFLALSKVVNELGALKTFAEDVEALAHALERGGVAASPHDAEARARALCADVPGRVDDVPRAARRIAQELSETRLLRRLRKELLRGFGPARP